MTSIRALRTFLCVAQSGGFAAASSKIGLTAAGVSQQMRMLEDELGQKLFDRVGKTVCLNERGMRFLPRARQLIEQFDELMSSSEDEEDPVGSIDVDAIASSMSLLVRATLQAREHYPRLTIRPAIGYSSDLSARVESGQSNAAVAVRSQRPIAPGMIWTTLYFEPFVFVAHRQSSEGQDMASLMRNRLFLRPSRGTHTGGQIDRFLKDQGITFSDCLEMNLSRTLVEMVEQDAGVTILPLGRYSSWCNNPKLRIEHLDKGGGQREIGFLENDRKRHLTSHVRRLLLSNCRAEQEQSKTLPPILGGDDS